ncbi:TIGR03943 family putative permease subunit [Microbacterium cremeum]|uniref:TIGR03943 family putative permease subunit n=1 Tax=Microbacterium cremeum TaxID=2782169 RepID=UPI001E30233C|nr:TIGR03943 family protein [Microbacterium cremeum]
MDSAHPTRPSRATSPAAALSVLGGALASAVVVGAWLLPPTTLSVALAIDRASASTALFDRDDAVALVSSGDTRHFGVPDWSTVFATATSPEDFVGDAVELEGFVTPHPEDPGVFLLTRLVITHCVIDAQPATVPVASEAWASDIDVGQWVRIEGAVTPRDDSLAIRPTKITPIDEPEDPYEY